MDPKDYLEIAQFLGELKPENIPSEIFYRTAINRLYYGIFHLVQSTFKIFIPQSEIHRIHAYVKEQLEHTPILGDYSELEVYRVEADYKISKKVSHNHYRDALRIHKRIVNKITAPKKVPYENDEDFYFKHRKS